ncbi:MAG: rhodanese-like domain-containing protein [Magnetococcales bacterium]|nr:rhodanese-like domain-containing protein [Magnetococcales bacterium]
MLFGTDKSSMTIEEFLADPITPLIIDTRGSSESDPTIPGSKRVYILEIEEHLESFEKRFAPQMVNRTMLLYCSKGDGSTYLQKKFSGKFRVQSLKGGMVSYLTTISHLLHEHPYQDPKKRGDNMVKLLAALTNCRTDPETFRKIIRRLLSNSPNPKFKALVR